MHHLSKSKGKPQKEEIFNEDSSSEEERRQDEELAAVASPSEQGEVISNNEQEQEQSAQQRQGEEVDQQIYDSSDEDQQRMQKQKRKREQQQRQREEEQIKFAALTQEDLLMKAFDDIERTNKRMALMRKKNAKRMQDIEKVRMTQQPYLITSNTHYRGSPTEYPLLTIDKSGRTILHPNYSLKVGEMRLADLIQKNIKEESSANYLNEVVKFQNYAYQQRKKRRQHIQ